KMNEPRPNGRGSLQVFQIVLSGQGRQGSTADATITTHSDRLATEAHGVETVTSLAGFRSGRSRRSGFRRGRLSRNVSRMAAVAAGVTRRRAALHRSAAGRRASA